MNAQKLDTPKINLDALVAMQKANIDALVEARNVLMGATQAIAKLQLGWYEQSLKHMQTLAKGDAAKNKPEDFFAEVKAVTERAMAVGKEQTDLGFKAQQQVAEIVTKRVQKTLENAKTVAA
ncbi:MAG: phasin family protein [Geminicoccaceae bacterium]|nr:phasin family protein [Geminicoccaceae bacterium]